MKARKMTFPTEEKNSRNYFTQCANGNQMKKKFLLYSFIIEARKICENKETQCKCIFFEHDLIGLACERQWRSVSIQNVVKRS